MTKARICVAKRPHLCSKCRGDILPGQEYLLAGSKKIHRSPDCEHAEPVEPWHPRPIPDDPYWKLLSQRIVWRCVRSYRVETATKDYDCWACEHSNSHHQQFLSTIYAGDPYDAYVYVSQAGWEIRRYHDSCPFVDPSDFDEESEEEDEDEATRAA